MGLPGQIFSCAYGCLALSHYTRTIIVRRVHCISIQTQMAQASSLMAKFMDDMFVKISQEVSDLYTNK